MELTFKESDYQAFREWIQLDMGRISWQGKYKKDFEDFWSLFFLEGLDLPKLVERFMYAQSESRVGPLSAWFTWLKEKFLCYVFITKGPNINQLAEKAQMRPSQLAVVLRNFFIDKFPHLDEGLNNLFQIGNAASSNTDLDYKTLSRELNLTQFRTGMNEDEIMPSMEITLYDDWRVFLKRMKRDFFHPQFNLTKIRNEASFKVQIRFLREIILLVFMGIVLIFTFKWFNSWYETYLADKISIYEPQFLWVEKSLKFRAEDEVVASNFKLDLDDLNKIAVEDKHIEKLGDEEERVNTESNVVLTSWDSLPRDFDLAYQEHSEYEEEQKQGLRDTTYGERKVYRVMMRSEDAEGLKKRLNALLPKYDILQSDSVRPGTEVPGGVYYNLFVPRTYLKEFISQVMDLGEGVLYESRTNVGNPPGQNKVFIWIKGM